MSLILDNVKYVYGENDGFRKTALRDINLVIEKNEFIGLIGHTGSGKSTLTQIMNGLIRPTSGNVFWNGEDIHEKGYDLRTLRQKIGLVFQYPEHQLFDSTVFADVCFGPKNMGLSRKDAELKAFEALELVGMDKELFYSSPFELSGGQKRRAAIAGVIAMKPEILILDEPTAGLDPKGRDEILDMIAELRKELESTVILVSHSMEDVAKYSDRILVMNEGELLYDDAPRAIFTHHRELEALGLSAPQVTYIMNMLKEKGFPVATDALTLDEGEAEILRLLKGKYNA